MIHEEQNNENNQSTTVVEDTKIELPHFISMGFSISFIEKYILECRDININKTTEEEEYLIIFKPEILDIGLSPTNMTYIKMRIHEYFVRQNITYDNNITTIGKYFQHTQPICVSYCPTSLRLPLMALKFKTLMLKGNNTCNNNLKKCLKIIKVSNKISIQINHQHDSIFNRNSLKIPFY